MVNMTMGWFGAAGCFGIGFGLGWLSGAWVGYERGYDAGADDMGYPRRQGKVLKHSEPPPQATVAQSREDR